MARNQLDYERIATQLETTARMIREDAATVMRATRFAEDETPRPQERGWDDITSTAVEKGVQARAANEKLVAKQIDLNHVIGLAYDNAVNTMEGIAFIKQRTTPAPIDPDANRPTLCCERYCEDPADPKRAGRCDPCYQWRRRNTRPGDVPPNVPRDVIDQRIKLRENKRVHVTGPLAEGAASTPVGAT